MSRATGDVSTFRVRTGWRTNAHRCLGNRSHADTRAQSMASAEREGRKQSSVSLQILNSLARLHNARESPVFPTGRRRCSSGCTCIHPVALSSSVRSLLRHSFYQAEPVIANASQDDDGQNETLRSHAFDRKCTLQNLYAATNCSSLEMQLSLNISCCN